ncbi:hypothetical protein OOU_Y34scaffold00679g26 [Pyricularia oryzae Y34]|uniref:Secreted protein n=2 Tax=Pyricularia oryzae TaxID=318829 RepID=A0AA97NTJ0_PYRO3|nr:hypothetical protein OOU_Y34scaffold00679g26 [Pyricularia oryzae Y34]
MRPFISILALTMVLGASASFNYAECIEDCVKEVTSNNNKSPQHIKPHHDGAKQAASGKDKPPQDIEKIRRDFSGPKPAGGATVAELALLAPLGPAEFIRHIALTTLKKMN